MAVAVTDPSSAPGKQTRVVRLRVIGGSIEIRDDVPRTRADCPTVTRDTPCPHVKCRHHLWMIDGRDRPGRRAPGRRLPSSELRPVWREWPLPRSCERQLLDSGETHGWTREQKAKALGLSVDSYQWTLRNATRKVREARGRGELDELRELGDNAPDKCEWGRAHRT